MLIDGYACMLKLVVDVEVIEKVGEHGCLKNPSEVVQDFVHQLYVFILMIGM